WGEEAFARARAEDKPVLLSVGYSACHWCHVMERESFENPEIAKIMNDNFVSIKVDREERPDIDSIYMTAVQAMTGSGGWPMTVFLTPEGKPFYGGTYFPPEDRGGMPSFPRVLQAIARAYREDRGSVARTTSQLLERMQAVASGARSLDPLTKDVLYQAYRGISSDFDDTYGGVGMQPKFPQPMTYEFLLRYYLRSNDERALEMVELTLQRMAEGGIYDQIGGGFHRYSTDTFWLVPHFEKMLYDNALLVKLYLHAYQVTGKPLYRRVVEETLAYALREMTSPEGGFYSAQDADSEGEEGKFFIWRPEQIKRALGDEDGEIVSRYYGVTREGNFEGRSILHVSENASEVAEGSRHGAEAAGMSAVQFEELLSRAKAKLLEAREQRVHPPRDDKILTSWNALMMRAFAEASAILNRPDYAEVAERNADFILKSLRDGRRLLRTHKDGRAKLNGYLEDYAFLIDALLALHEVTFGERWLKEAIALGEDMVELFWDGASQQFYDTGIDHEALVVRPRDISDNAVPSGSSMAADALLRLAVIVGDQEHQRRAVASLRAVKQLMERFPTGAGQWLCALDFYLSTPKEIAIIGDIRQEDARALLSEVFRKYIPNRVLVGTEGEDGTLGGLSLPLLEYKNRMNGRATAYVCENYACMMPVNDAAALAEQLGE
ncbi:MAG: thioredoxin domain-containing protein, partial [Chloroflexi bacterium]|nr:thioredoxin domain-containing protein [Chloroflexota bacterium]